MATKDKTAAEIAAEIIANSNLPALMRAIKAAGDRAYKKGVREKGEMAVVVYPDVVEHFNKSNVRRLEHDYIIEVLRKRGRTDGGKAQGYEPAGEQQTFLFDDWEAIYQLRRPMRVGPDGMAVEPHTEFIKLGDFDQTDIEQHRRQMEANIKAANQELEKWDQAVALVGPLLAEHSNWRWRDAEQFLRDNDLLP